MLGRKRGDTREFALARTRRVQPRPLGSSMRIEVVVLDVSRPPRRFAAGEGARNWIVDAAPLLGREDYYLAMLLPRAGDFDLPE